MRKPPRRFAALLLVAGLVVGVAACTGTDDKPHDRSGAAPTSVEAGLTSDSGPTELEISFAPVADADGYVVTLGDSEPIRLGADGCDKDRCTVRLDRRSAGAAQTATVAALEGEAVSDASDQVELPEWPTAERPKPPEDEPVRLVVSRQDDAGRLTVETEEVPADVDPQARIDALWAEPAVVSVGPDSAATPLLSAGGGSNRGDPPPGETTWQQAALEYDVLPESRGEGVTVAVIDDGVAADHPSLAGADVDAVDAGGLEPGIHGTPLVSLIAGAPDAPVPGIAPRATVRAYDMYDGDPTWENILDGTVDANQAFRAAIRGTTIVRAVDDGADVLLLAEGFVCDDFRIVAPGCPDEVLRPAVEYAEAHGVVVVAAAGNDGDRDGVVDECDDHWGQGMNLDTWPAKLDAAIAVGGITPDGSVWECSPEKSYLDVLAPAVRLQVADVGGGHRVASGTSGAAALVAGFVADVLAEQPDLPPSEVRSLIRRCTGENGQLVPSLCLREAGIGGSGGGGGGGPVVDPGTGDTLMPFAAQLSFPPGHPIYEAAVATHDVEHLNFGRWTSTPLGNEPFTTQVTGTLVVRDDGAITGRASLAPLAGDTMVVFDGAHIDRIGHLVECPVGDAVLGRPKPYLLFDWNVPVTVTGMVEDDSGGGTDSQAMELTLAPDGVSDMTVLTDTFHTRCPAALNAYYLTPGQPAPGDPTWAEASGRPASTIDAIEPVYTRFVAAGPFTFSGVYSAAATPDQTFGTSGDADGVGVQLLLGSSDTTGF